MLISCAVTVQLICAFVFAYEKSSFSHDAAYIILRGTVLTCIVDLGIKSQLKQSVTVQSSNIAHLSLCCACCKVKHRQITLTVGSLRNPSKQNP